MSKKAAGFDWRSPKILDFLMEILILIVIFIMPTIFDRRLGIVFSGTKTAWMRVLAILLLSIWSIKLIINREHRFFRTALDWPVVSFLLCTTIATLTSVHVYTSFVGFYGRYEGLTSWYCFGVFFFVATNYLRSLEQIKRALVTVVSAGTVMAVYSMVQRFELDPYQWGGVVTWQRVIGTIGQPNFLAAYMLMAFFLGLALIMTEKKGQPREIRWSDQLYPVACYLAGPLIFLLMIYSLEAHDFVLWYVSFVLITLAALLFAFNYKRLTVKLFNILLGLSLVLIYISVLYTQSRGGYLGLFTGAVIFGLAVGRHWLFSHWKKIAVFGFLIVLISGVTMMRPEFSPFARFASEISTEEIEKADSAPDAGTESKLELRGAAGSRGETWKSAFGIIADHPFFGIGPEVMKMIFPRYETELFRFKETFHVKQDRCHNETFDVGVTKGLVTFFVYIWLLFVLFRVGWRKATAAAGDKKILLAGFLSASVAFLIQNQFSFGVVAITSLFWMIWAFIMVVGEEKEEEKEKEKEKEKGGGQGLSWTDIPWLPVAAVIATAALLIYFSFLSFRGDIWFKGGKTRTQINRIPDAVEMFERSLAIFPYEGSTVSHLGIAYLHFSQGAQGKNDGLNKAIATLKYGTKVDPYNADNFFMLARIYYILHKSGQPGALQEALDYANKALKIDPYYAEVFHVRGLIYEKQGRMVEAARDFEMSFNINPGLAAPMQNLENLYRRSGQPEKILRTLERFLEKYHDNIPALERVTRMYLERGEVARAGKAAEKIVRNDPTNPMGYIYRAMVFMRRGAYDQAFGDLQYVLRKDPRNVAAHNELGRFYLMTGNAAKAREEFESVLMLDHGNAFAKRMLERLK